ncbi:putative protein kinase RLK-Pelle-LRR-XI-1 family [Helianthus debilis subsp. tardiflorus]
MKQFHVISFDEGEILGSLIPYNLIGIGSSDNVYKVELRCGKKLAVKHMWRSGLDSGDPRSYLSSATILPKKKSRWPEYDAEVATLSSIQHVNVAETDWNVRYKIAMGAAKGLEYLHHGCDRPVILRDVKSSNILLDEEMKLKIVDFGLAKIMQTNKATNSSHVIAGTYSYIAPELVTRRKPVEPEFGENKDIVRWVHDEMRNKEDTFRIISDRVKIQLF